MLKNQRLLQAKDEDYGCSEDGIEAENLLADILCNQGWCSEDELESYCNRTEYDERLDYYEMVIQRAEPVQVGGKTLETVIFHWIMAYYSHEGIKKLTPEGVRHEMMMIHMAELAERHQDLIKQALNTAKQFVKGVK